MSIPFTAGATFPMLEFFDRVKRDRTGVSSDGQGLSPDALKNIQMTVLAQAADLSRQKIEVIARIFAETGIKSLFAHIHELLLKHQTSRMKFRLRNKWIEVDPREWRTRRDMTVNVGLGIGTREQNLLHLNAIWDKQMQLASGGGMNLIVTPQNLYRTASEIVKNANLRNPSLYFADPGTALAPPPPDQAQQLQAQAMQLEQRRQMLDAQDQEIKRGKLELEMARERQKQALDAENLRLKREEVENKLMIAMEQIRNQLTELELKYARNVPGAAL
jgi:hypothetical protein